jgi:hypothetical protein
MKNHYLFLCLFFFSVTATFAQGKKEKKAKENKETTTEKKNYVELGVNVTTAIASGGFHFADKLIASDPYILHLKFVRQKFAIRLGAGASILSQKKGELINSRITSGTNVDLRLGFDYQVPIDKHWRLYYGFDVLTGYGEGQSDTSIGGDVTDIRYEEKSIGGGPILGLQYHINKRISLQTEGTLYLKNTTRDKTLTYRSLPNLPPQLTSDNEWTMPVGIPRSLFVIIRF